MKRKNSSALYLVGIDLGTTHTVVAFTTNDPSDRTIQIFPIEQLVAPGQVAARPLLPSVRYHPAAGELSDTDLAFPVALSATDKPAIIGEAARLLGAKTQGRLVTSAKSWLSHPSVDQNADILPWGSDNGIDKISPVAASASYLAHIRMVWRHRFPDAPLEQQELVITVPASFDEAARSLTLDAAQLAGLSNVRLLEEPQAVCYDWLRRHREQNTRQSLQNTRLLLVCDVGGGTTDFTLIKIEQQSEQIKLTRIGVGDHLMLGGDNIDLALAHLVESRLGYQEQRLSAAALSQLIEQCRIAKEKLLANDAPEEVKVTLLGTGSQLIGNTRSVLLSKQEVHNLTLDGFFPLTGINELPDKKRSGVVEFGLPYAAEPAISKHIAAFLQLHSQSAHEALGKSSHVPDALLLNGGVFRSEPIAQRLVALIHSWSGQLPVVLENQHPELAVAFGAVSYAMARRDNSTRIGGGSARSYFLLIDTESGSRQRAICILPKGSEEGEEVILKDHRFALRLGIPVRFHLVSWAGDSTFKTGEMTDITDEFHSLPPLAVAFNGDNDQPTAEIIVELAISQTELGTLKIQCIAVDNSDQRWDVEFQIRKNSTSALVDSNLPNNFHQLTELIRTVFGTKSKQVDPKSVKNLRADLEKTIGLPRAEWPTSLLRALFTQLLDGAKYQRRSEHHERVWLSLVGFCLRPGFGHPLDDWRIEQIWKYYPQGIQFIHESQNWAEWWTLWRRVAGGLSVEAQEKIFADISKYLDPSSARQPSIAKQLKTRSYDDMVRLAAVLERLSIANKIHLATWLFKRLEKPSESVQSWWAIGRIGARIPFHGSSHNVVPADTVSLWLEQILSVDWKKIPQASFAATLLTRMSGDRTRDIDPTMRHKVLEKLRQNKAPNSWLTLVEQTVELNEAEEKQIFGEALPPGLKLISKNI